jgi:hypothetical protein
VVLTSRSGDNTYRVIAALARKGSWRLETLAEHGALRRRIFVDTYAPGRYVRSEALDGPASPESLLALRCARRVAVFGTTESTEYVACRARGRWYFVQTLD